MPLYFFNARINGELILDSEGQDLHDPDHAWAAARTVISELLRSEQSSPGLLDSVMEVTDEHGELVFEFPFTEALNLPPERG